jgi:hypothetical protein
MTSHSSEPGSTVSSSRWQVPYPGDAFAQRVADEIREADRRVAQVLREQRKPYVPTVRKIINTTDRGCVKCGAHLDEYGAGCLTCKTRHYRRRKRFAAHKKERPLIAAPLSGR